MGGKKGRNAKIGAVGANATTASIGYFPSDEVQPISQRAGQVGSRPTKPKKTRCGGLLVRTARKSDLSDRFTVRSRYWRGTALFTGRLFSQARTYHWNILVHPLDLPLRLHGMRVSITFGMRLAQNARGRLISRVINRAADRGIPRALRRVRHVTVTCHTSSVHNNESETSRLEGNNSPEIPRSSKIIASRLLVRSRVYSFAVAFLSPRSMICRHFVHSIAIGCFEILKFLRGTLSATFGRILHRSGNEFTWNRMERRRQFREPMEIFIPKIFLGITAGGARV